MKPFNVEQGSGKPDMPKSLYSSGEFARLNGVNKRTFTITMKSGCSILLSSEKTDITTIPVSSPLNWN